MNCEDLNGYLLEYFEKIMDWEKRKYVEEHVDRCSDCQALMKTYQMTIFLGSQILPKEPSANLYRQIRQSQMGWLPASRTMKTIHQKNGRDEECRPN